MTDRPLRDMDDAQLSDLLRSVERVEEIFYSRGLTDHKVCERPDMRTQFRFIRCDILEEQKRRERGGDKYKESRASGYLKEIKKLIRQMEDIL